MLARYAPCLTPMARLMSPKIAIEGSTIIRIVEGAIGIGAAISPPTPSATIAMNSPAVVPVVNFILRIGDPAA